MTVIQFVINAGFVCAMMIVGAWLETINGVHGLLDKFFTPVPMGASGLFIVFIKWELT